MAMNEKVTIQIGNRQISIEMEELTQLEITGLAQLVTERMAEVQGSNRSIVDSSKLALIVALSFAAELQKERASHETTKRLLDNSADRLSQLLNDSLQSSSDASALER